MPYYRAMSTLEDTTDMDGNCAAAQPGFGKNEMYPCIDEAVTYGLAVTGLAVDYALTEQKICQDGQGPKYEGRLCTGPEVQRALTVRCEECSPSAVRAPTHAEMGPFLCQKSRNPV